MTPFSLFRHSYLVIRAPWHQSLTIKTWQMRKWFMRPFSSTKTLKNCDILATFLHIWITYLYALKFSKFFVCFFQKCGSWRWKGLWSKRFKGKKFDALHLIKSLVRLTDILIIHKERKKTKKNCSFRPFIIAR